MANPPSALAPYPHRSLLGDPGKGIHARRIGPGSGFAAADVVGTLLLAAATVVAIVVLLGVNLATSLALSLALFLPCFVVWLAAAVGIHYAFGVDTRLNVRLFGRRNPLAGQ